MWEDRIAKIIEANREFLIYIASEKRTQGHNWRIAKHEKGSNKTTNLGNCN